ncbi:MAG: hypothetical protein GW906_06330 [Epsilonproteobacteria bacterium]|nr:hypothetical protein [Campylobacterota bacterium]OIO17811.1 MAG: hypothetical protein AUJ81_01045 [Helicobacteraceae bacterium CG1_02_36_14]PIP10509.1 MAG: hypothetical protein COX50_05275 [Sulfurimonas sp. CG23_combo_of_CG06-09_8_20_14_all_36_33]PIS26959.1 MAG: hypothetical protein COT46_00550 [Sulfurimonas sp. CG08_land_8_20_14_0_20_36_33]PIU35853.1 MAG: hypothetical protein COT05_01525 [Sulfurimonas sp. CG07_land_8_20_14_0_80_36_56]PIV03430.1 MAG: hypothetical protein COS56_08380 [Sulfur
MFVSKRELNDIYDRLRDAENSLSINIEHDKNLESLFKTHDINEMKKYDSIDESIKKLSQNQYIAVGILIAYEYFTK